MLRISEVYLSIQGEGPRVGCPTIFVRFAGCNLRCPGWPCDTQHAIDPSKYRMEWQNVTPLELIKKIIAIAGGRQVNICFTGGEPLLQNKAELLRLIDYLINIPNIREIECFTNGTQLLLSTPRLRYVLDWKLPGSGEIIKPGGMREENIRNLRPEYDAIKFTIANYADYERAKNIFTEYFMVRVANGFEYWPNIYYGVVWGKLTNEELINWVLKDKLPWKLNVQIHNHIWDRSKRGI